MAFSCASCGRSFKTQDGLAHHTRVKHEWPCHPCNRSFGSLESLHQHQEASPAHSNGRLVPVLPPASKWHCQPCDRAFGSPEALEQHQNDSLAHAPWHCEPCERVFKTQEAIQQHQEDSLAHASWHCEPCERAFKTQEALEQHREDSPAHTTPTWHCQLCDRSYVSQEVLEQHRENSPAHRTPTWHCQPCDRSFGSQEALEQHREDSPAHTTPTWHCQPCDRSFGCQEALKQHRGAAPAHIKLPSRPNPPTQSIPALPTPLPTIAKGHWHCQPCDRSFESPEALEQHRGDSLAHPAWYCEPCERAFISQEALEQHREDSLAHTMAATWHCNLCDRSFGSQEALEQHQGDSPAHTKRASQFQRSQPPLQPVPVLPAPSRWRCQPCERSFGSQEALEQHRGDSPAHTNPPSQPQPPTQPTVLGITMRITPAQMLSHRLAVLSLNTDFTRTPSPEPPTIPPPLTCRGNTYTTLTPSEQATLYARLLNHCHTTARLKRERYPLPPTATTPFPPPNHYPSSRPKYKAVVLDCEMVGVRQGTEQVVTLSLIDFFTGATLINTVVEPDPARYTVTDWRSAITGVSAARMASAVAQGRALGGKEGAVARLFEYVDSQTVLVGQAVKGDLKALGLGHGRIVDSALLTAEASGVFGGDTTSKGRGGKMAGRVVGLERLCRELTGVRIREGAMPGLWPKCHDSLEDVLAAREVVIWCLQHPVELREWARKNWKVAPTTARGGSGSNNKARRGGGGGRGGGSGYAARSTRSYAWESDDDSDDDREVLRWEDVVDWDTWLKSPPDWSD